MSAPVIVNVAPEEFPTISVTIKTYIHSPVISVQLIYAFQLSVAVAQVLLSVKSIVTHVVYIAPLAIQVKVGSSLSIQSTVAIASHVFPVRSSKVYVYIPFTVKVYQVAFNPVTASLNPVTIVTISQLVHVHEAGVYSTCAVGGTVSGAASSIVKVAHVLFPAISVTINT